MLLPQNVSICPPRLLNVSLHWLKIMSTPMTLRAVDKLPLYTRYRHMTYFDCHTIFFCFILYHFSTDF